MHSCTASGCILEFAVSPVDSVIASSVWYSPCLPASGLGHHKRWKSILACIHPPDTFKEQSDPLLPELQIENREKREEEIHLAELTATARNDEEVIAKLHKVTLHMSWHLNTRIFLRACSETQCMRWCVAGAS